MPFMHNLRERYGDWALVTGASSGIGHVFAQKLAAYGLNLVIAARRIDLLNDLGRQLTRDHGVQIRCLQADLSQDDCLKSIVEVCRDIEVGMVVNNAGSGVPGAFSQSDFEVEKGLIRLNCISPSEITRHFLPGMLARRKGAILFVSSLMGFQGVAYMANYSATKGYLLNFGEALHHECKDQGVDILVCAPGATETPGKYLHPIDYSKLPISWMSPEEVVDTALKNIGRKVFIIPGVRNHLTACLSGGLWSRGFVQGVMKRLARIALPPDAQTASPTPDGRDERDRQITWRER
jgi:short-subunit dehydrogenase